MTDAGFKGLVELARQKPYVASLIRDVEIAIRAKPAVPVRRRRAR